MSEGSRQLYVVTIVSIVVLALLNGVALYYLSSRGGQQTILSESGASVNVISVSGTGTAYANPDMAYVTVAVVTQSATATEAQEKNADTMRNVIESMKKIGITEADMRTEQYSLRPIYNYDKEPRIISYECRNSLRVTWKRINELGIVIDTAVKAGSNSIGTVTFALSEQKMDALKIDAIKSAVADANSKAQAMASALGVRIVGKTSASIGAPYTATQALEFRADATQIIPSELQVRVTVQVNYRFS